MLVLVTGGEGLPAGETRSRWSTPATRASGRSPSAIIGGDSMIAHNLVPSADQVKVLRPMSVVSMSPVGVILVNEPARPSEVDR